jgi:hypothetical protein
MRQQDDLKAYLRQSVAQAKTDNERRQKLVARYPDLNEQMHALPGHTKWSGSVGGNKRTAAIVAEAERRDRETHIPAQPARTQEGADA